jgi:hypothetical protein
VSAKGRDASVQSAHLGFLETGRFPAKPKDYAYWFSLDFLGFFRPNQDLSMGYAGFSRAEFFIALFPGVERARTEACGRGHAEAQDCS